jgi:hypothetical protein
VINQSAFGMVVNINEPAQATISPENDSITMRRDEARTKATSTLSHHIISSTVHISVICF